MPSAPALPSSDSFMWNFATLAQDAVVMPGNPAQTSAPGTSTPPGAPGGATPQPQGSPFGSFWLILFVFLIVMIVSQVMASRRERRKREGLLRGIAKHDKVQTVGGIIGTVVEFRGDDAVVLKVDENSNTRITFSRSAIQQVIKSSGSGSNAGGGQAPSVEVRPTNQGASKV